MAPKLAPKGFCNNMFWKVTIIVVLGILNIVLFSKMIWGPTGIMEYRALKQQHGNLKTEIARLDAENMILSRDIRLMQSDPLYVEKMVRQRLHYLRDNEIVYLFATQVGNGATGDDGKN